MKLSQLLRILRAHFGLIAVVLACAWLIGGAITALMPPKFVATSSVLVKFSDNAASGGAAPPATLYPTYLATQVDLLASQTVALKVVGRLRLVEDAAARKRFLGSDSSFRESLSRWKDRLLTRLNKKAEAESNDADDAAEATDAYRLADQLLRRSTFRPSPDSSVIQVSYAATTAKAAAEASNTIVKAYMDASLELNVDPARASSEWLDTQVAKLTQEVEAARAKLTEYQQRSGIVSVTGDDDTSRLNDLNSQLIAAQAQNHPAIQALKNDLARAQAKMNELPAQLGANHPTYKKAQSEVTALRVHLEQESERLAGDLRREIGEQKGSMLQMRRKQSELAALKDAVDNAQHALDDTTQKATQTRMSSQATQTNIAVVRVAVPPRAPTTPNPLFNFAIATFIGIVFGIGCALWREVVCRFVRSADDLRDFLGVQVLGTLHSGRLTSTRARFPRENLSLLTAQQ